jgi:phage host-nuclease inhibitor protein Gam
VSALDEFLAGGEPPGAGQQEHFRVDGPSTAEWALRKLRQARARQDEARALAEAETSRVAEWLRAEEARHQHDIEFFESVLTGWHRALLAEDPDRKTISLPNGTLRARKAPDALDVVDPDGLVAWAQANAHEALLRVTVEPDKAAIKRLRRAETLDGAVVPVDDTGERLPGVVVVIGQVRFSVEVAR